MAGLILRFVLRLYPSWFREECEDELLSHLRRERSETRYRGPVGGLKFWFEVGWDALATGVRLRIDGEENVMPEGAGRIRGTNGGGVGQMMESIWTDVRLAFRGLRRNPGYAAVFVLTLGLGIGANTAMFSAVNGVLLRPLPHAHGEQLVYLRHSAELADIDNALFSVPEIDDYRQRAGAFEAVAEFSALTFTMLGYDEPRRVRAGIVTGNYFGVMGLSATHGRTIEPRDDGDAAPAVIVLSDAYWREVFGADPEILGKTVEINGRTATFVGVAEPSPPYPERTDIYVNLATSPHHLDASMNFDRVHRMTEVFARLSPGASLESARAEVSAITAALHQDHPEAYDAGSGYTVSVTPLKAQLTSRARPTLLVLLATAFLVLLIACANLANLALTRVLRRDRELAIRASLGGSRASLRRALLAESLVLAIGGALAGLVIAFASLDMLVAFTERLTSRAPEIALNGSVFGFAFLAALGASAFFTLVPPLPRGDALGGALRRAGTRMGGASHARRMQQGLVVLQIAMSFILLIGAGLLVRTLSHLNHIDPGFDVDQVLTMEIPANTAGRTGEEIRDHYLGVLEDVRAIPGVRSAALTNAIPLSGTVGGTTQFKIGVEGFEPVAGQPTPRADLRVVSPDYFETMGIDLLSGRDFARTDEVSDQAVVIINQAMAKSYFGDQDPVGRQIAWRDEVMRFLGVGPEYRTVIGVVADTRDAGLDGEVIHTMYNPYPQVSWSGALMIRTGQDPLSIMPQVREALMARDSRQPIENVATMQTLSSESVAPRRLNTILLGAFASLALVIAAVGIGGVLAFSVGSRTREFGVRSALGAARHEVWSGVVAEGATLAAVGLGLGVVGALALTRYISSLLVGVPALDPVTFVAVGVLLAGVAIAAAWAPAWRAAAVSPLEALRSE